METPFPSSFSRPASSCGRVDPAALCGATGLPDVAQCPAADVNRELCALFNRLSAFEDEDLVLEATAYVEAYTADPCVSLIEEATVQHVVGCMRVCPHAAGLARVGCACLANVAACGDGGRGLAADAGAAEVALESLAKHPDDARLSYCALDVLATLASGSPAARAALADAAGVGVIVAALRRHRRCRDVQFGAACALASAVLLSPECVAAVVSANGLAALVACFKEASVQSAAAEDVVVRKEWTDVMDWSRLALRNIARCTALVRPEMFDDKLFGRFGECIAVDELKIELKFDCKRCHASNASASVAP